MKSHLLTAAILVGLLFMDCTGFLKNHDDDKVIAAVGAKKLTMSQLKMAIPKNMKEIDSISFSQNYIEKWVKSQLLVEKAELNLDKKTQNGIETMIDNYRTSLLIFKYQQAFIDQKLDTVVNDQEIRSYYNDHSENFKLDSNVVKAIFVKLPKSQYNAYNVTTWMRSGTEEDLIKLEDFCYQNAKNFYMGEDWQYFGSVMLLFPKEITDQEDFLESGKYHEVSDSIYNYYLSVTDYRLVNDIAPLEFAFVQIKDIIINHRKIKLIKDLENNIYNDAVNQKRFTIYTN
ncbi:MAG TPA: hypothetical protein DCQ26_06535 [Marinilabiliales bacterium]|jgi:hypothetical protein|nr:MAG: hypothetical protein A2W95_09375 [Bacteroidetes bacterium GWA2_40_14]OFX60262.1 MAG: hypothetical protein A2W84_05645 [Bacteroidetes bacterium GWC2_40_13]OFX74168.1 MAG: hypothetical protein A2W96_12760 [Bacteroidetes bacterium GWD2_40_43]OFX92998.1 MAG: hypothetical protein A2W97_05315 [Bacteroidetes bacterium GWE2_40_63]OFY21367.1 MAG: hypothetical protein A2W88_09310 [Bacteroidetes bacterium GWF2_40_13]HAM98250.1 hypothetical protein [Marinilabiliales bacterium]